MAAQGCFFLHFVPKLLLRSLFHSTHGLQTAH